MRFGMHGSMLLSMTEGSVPMKADSAGKHAKRWIVCSVCLLVLCMLLSAILTALYVKAAAPQRLLAKLGFHCAEPIDWTLESWNSSLEQLEYDADIVFIGDSLTRGENFQAFFPEKKIVNLGLSGDTLSGISKRAYIIRALTPEKIFIEGGVNSLSSGSVEELSALYDTMTADIIAGNPDAAVYIQSILPVSNANQKGRLTNENILKINEALQEIAARQGAVYIDLHSLYVLNGEMNPAYTKDGLHLKDEAKNLWLEAISKYVL